jgi:hypothetical protein
VQSAEGCVTLRARARPVAARLPARFGLLAREFPSVIVEAPSAGDAAIHVEVAAWRDPSFDLWSFDRAMDRAAETKELTIELVGAAAELPGVSLEVLIRCQRLVSRRNEASASAGFDAVLACHRALHDLSLPLVQADFDHALDTWQWVVRLEPRASLSVQIAALFHDVERLVSESQRRIEQHALDYQQFKNDHAVRGAELATALLHETGVPARAGQDAARLIAMHEQRSQDREAALLADADALSFFSLNSAGFADYYGPEHTRMKIAYSLNRMGAGARRYLGLVRLRDDVRTMLEDLCGRRAS